MTLLGVREAARRLGVHENTLRRWEQSGLIRAVKLPTGVRRFRAEDIERLHEEMHRAVDEAATKDPE
jgi:putative resolvase